MLSALPLLNTPPRHLFVSKKYVRSSSTPLVVAVLRLVGGALYPAPRLPSLARSDAAADSVVAAANTKAWRPWCRGVPCVGTQ